MLDGWAYNYRILDLFGFLSIIIINGTRIIFDYMPSLSFGVVVVIEAIYGLKANKNGFYLIISVSIFALIYIKILAIYYTSYIPLFVLMVYLRTFPICFGAILSIIGGVLGVSKS